MSVWHLPFQHMPFWDTCPTRITAILRHLPLWDNCHSDICSTDSCPYSNIANLRALPFRHLRFRGFSPSDKIPLWDTCLAVTCHNLPFLNTCLYWDTCFTGTFAFRRDLPFSTNALPTVALPVNLLIPENLPIDTCLDDQRHHVAETIRGNPGNLKSRNYQASNHTQMLVLSIFRLKRLPTTQPSIWVNKGLPFLKG